MQSIAFFDLDFTITTRDTMFKFLKFTHGKIRFYMNFLLLFPVLILYKIKLIPNWKAKKIVLGFFYKGWAKELLWRLGDRFAIEKIPEMLNNSAVEKIKWHISKNHQVVIVTASMDIWVKKWAEQWNLSLISTKMEFQNGLYTGHFATPNCYGEEKVVRIIKTIELAAYEKIYAYGDSKSDLPMMNLAHERFYRTFN